jgi:putative hydrolase of HD superfamily
MATISQLKAVLDMLTLAGDMTPGLNLRSPVKEERTASHAWRFSLMAILMEPYLEHPINLGKIIKMMTVRNFVELETGDTSIAGTFSHASQKLARQRKVIAAIDSLKDKLGDPLGKEIYAHWFELELNSSYDAKVANAIHKLEAALSETIHDKLGATYSLPYLNDQHVGFDASLKMLWELIENQAEEQPWLRSAG